MADLLMLLFDKSYTVYTEQHTHAVTREREEVFANYPVGK